MISLQIPLYVSIGAILGSLYLSGLWWTVIGLQRAKRPLLLLAASATLRLLLLLAVFAVVTGLERMPLVACAAGFLMVRLVVALWPHGQKTPRDSVS